MTVTLISESKQNLCKCHLQLNQKGVAMTVRFISTIIYLKKKEQLTFHLKVRREKSKNDYKQQVCYYHSLVFQMQNIQQQVYNFFSHGSIRASVAF